MKWMPYGAYKVSNALGLDAGSVALVIFLAAAVVGIVALCVYNQRKKS